MKEEMQLYSEKILKPLTKEQKEFLLKRKTILSDNTKICIGTITDKFIIKKKDNNNKRIHSVFKAVISINGEISNYPLKNKYSINIDSSTYFDLNIGDNAYLILYTPENPDAHYMEIFTIDYFDKYI